MLYFTITLSYNYNPLSGLTVNCVAQCLQMLRTVPRMRQFIRGFRCEERIQHVAIGHFGQFTDQVTTAAVFITVEGSWYLHCTPNLLTINRVSLNV